MKRGKHERKSFKIIEVYSVLILIATLFMGIGCAQISDINLAVEGTIEAESQDGVFITDIIDITNTDDTSTDTINSQINYYTETMIDSTIVLGNTNDSSITYEVTLYNNSDKEYMFIDVITDKSDSTLYSNTDIEYRLDELQPYITTIFPKESLSFTITFQYIDGADLTNNTLTSKLNFRFKEIPKLILSNDKQTYTLNDIYPDYTPQEYKFTVSNYDETETNIVPMTYSFATTIDSPLTAKIYDANGSEVTGSISMGGDGTTKIDHTYTLKIIWDNSKSSNYNSLEYANREFNCSVVLNASPVDEKYLEYTETKQFTANINSATFNFNTNATTDISIQNDVATLPMAINNYSSNTNYNKFNTTYEISIEGNDKFTFSVNDESPVNGVITKTLSGNSKIDDSLNIKFMADMNNLNLTESLTLKINVKLPYVKVITVPINISFHTVTVNLNANGGMVNPSSITVYQSKTYADLPTPIWNGHTFNGWYSAATGGTKYETTTEVTTTSSTQTLYAQWTSRLLADLVSVGDTVDYPVTYANVGTTSSNTHIPKDNYLGWRVLSVEGSGDNKYVRLVSAGIPLAYRHAAINTTSGPSSVTNLTTNFFETDISSSSANYYYHACGFKNGSTTLANMDDVKALFNNSYTQISNNVPMVQSITKADVEAALGITVANLTDLRSYDLFAIPSKDQTSEYAPYYMATACEGYYLWSSFKSGYAVYTYSVGGIRPVVTLKVGLETTGQIDGVWQLTEE